MFSTRKPNPSFEDVKQFLSSASTVTARTAGMVGVTEMTVFYELTSEEGDSLFPDDLFVAASHQDEATTISLWNRTNECVEDTTTLEGRLSISDDRVVRVLADFLGGYCDRAYCYRREQEEKRYQEDVIVYYLLLIMGKLSPVINKMLNENDGEWASKASERVRDGSRVHVGSNITYTDASSVLDSLFVDSRTRLRLNGMLREFIMQANMNPPSPL